MSTPTSSNDFTGTGWGFPPTFIPPTFTDAPPPLRVVSREDDIDDSLNLILSTRPGERAMQPDFGCPLDRFMFEPLDTTTMTHIADIVETAVLLLEPRVEPVQVQFDTRRQSEGILLIEVTYRIRATNSRRNFVYPFAVNEGTELASPTAPPPNP